MDLNDLTPNKSTTVSIVERPYREQVKIGKDVIDRVEYLVFKRSECLEDKPKAKTLKRKLEAIWDTLSSPYYKAKREVRELYYKIKYGFQRMFKGYDAVDTFETYSRFIERYTKIIQDIKNHHNGYPAELTEEAWDIVLEEMLYHLYYMDEAHIENELEKDVPDDWAVNLKTVYEIMEKHKNTFFELFSKYFYNLWD